MPMVLNGWCFIGIKLAHFSNAKKEGILDFQWGCDLYEEGKRLSLEHM